MIKRKNIIKIAIDSPAAAGAGTLAKAISKHYNLFYLDTGKIYRFLGNLKIKYKKKFKYSLIKKKINKLEIKNLKLYFDSPITLAKKFRLRGIPTSILFNKEGYEFARIIGSIDFKDKKFIEWLSNYN